MFYNALFLSLVGSSLLLKTSHVSPPFSQEEIEEVSIQELNTPKEEVIDVQQIEFDDANDEND